MLTYEQKLQIAVKHLQRLATERMLTNGNVSSVARQHGVKVTDLKKAYR